MFENYLSVGDLKKSLEGLPDETPVYYERIEDVYFEKHGWNKHSIILEDEFGENQYTRAFNCGSDRIRFLITAHY